MARVLVHSDGNKERVVVLGADKCCEPANFASKSCALRYSPTAIPFGVGAMRGKEDGR